MVAVLDFEPTHASRTDRLRILQRGHPSHVIDKAVDEQIDLHPAEARHIVVLIGYAFLKGWGADPEFLPGRVANLFLHLLDERFMFFEQTPVFGADEFADFPEVVANVIKNALETFLVLELSVELSVHLVRIGNWRYWFVRSGIRHPRPGISPVGDADAKLQRTKACARFFLALEIVL